MIDLRAQLANRLEWREHPLREVGRAVQERPDTNTTQITFSTRHGASVRGILCRPRAMHGPLPTVLVIHAHGNRHDIGADEILHGRPALVRPLGPELATLGIQTLCLDMPCFGTRAGVSESAAAKAALWQGGSLAGQMIGENVSALDWVCASGLADHTRLAVFGISMGATLGMWLAAIDTRIRAVVQECCFADYAALIDTGAHDLHGLYLTVPNLLSIASNGQIAAMIAPRSQFIGWGVEDPLTPAAAISIALEQVQAGYQNCKERLILHPEERMGHSETPAMRMRAVEFMCTQLLG